MSEHNRTLLVEYPVNQKVVSLTEKVYSVVVAVRTDYPGFETDRITTRIVDNHYLLERKELITLGTRKDLKNAGVEAFGICEEHTIADARMYQKALEIALEKSSRDENKLLDLTFRGYLISGEDRKFVPEEFLYRCFSR